MQIFASPIRRSLPAIFLLIILTTAACQPKFEGRPTAKPTLVPTATNTATITLTPSPAPTVTPSPTHTLTSSPTPVPSATATATATPIPTRLATLFPLTAGGYQTVDWNYFYISRKESRADDSLLSLSATVAFQLLDRGIHSEKLTILDNDVTVYYLRVSHTFNGTPIETRLVLTGVFGTDIPISAVPADGSAYINFRTQNSDQVFEPWNIHRDWLLPYEQRSKLFNSVVLSEFEELLADLPDKVIVLAHHPVIWRPDDFPQVRLDMTRISAEAARLEPFFTYDQFNYAQDQTQMADAWRYYLVNKQNIPTAIAQKGMRFSAEYLVIIVP